MESPTVRNGVLLWAPVVLRHPHKRWLYTVGAPARLLRERYAARGLAEGKEEALGERLRPGRGEWAVRLRLWLG